MTAGLTRLDIAPRQVTFALPDGTPVVLPFGARSLAEAGFRHDPPTPLELEQAIDRVEDALTATRLPSAARGTLVTSDPGILALPGLEVPGARLTRDAVEALFQQLASASLGNPAARAGLPTGGEAPATLVILRECMHHLGFEAVQSAAG